MNLGMLGGRQLLNKQETKDQTFMYRFAAKQKYLRIGAGFTELRGGHFLTGRRKAGTH